MLKKSLLAIIIFSVAGECFASDTLKNTLTLQAGMSYIARQDLVFSPFIHQDVSWMNFGLSYERHAKLFHRVAVRYGGFNPVLTQSYEFMKDGKNETAYPHSFSMIDIDYLIGKNIKKTSKTSTIIGGAFSTDIQALNYVYGRISSFGYYSALGIGVFVKQNFDITPKHKLSASIQVPLAAWYARSPYLVNDDEFIENISSHSGFKSLASFIGDGKMVTLNRLQSIDFQLGYKYHFNQRWSLGAEYLLEFVHTSQPRNLLSYRQSVNLSANFSF